MTEGAEALFIEDSDEGIDPSKELSLKTGLKLILLLEM